ncbi:hypothetical protein Acor_33560 [Acrocarpospora corrugata]|uniref:Uncharacterized protein n=1 Tax=Acrocarpospora corrugata TaxID=35763 RepID=A0A5M3VZU7_9ACTN|nr:DUF6232 family protein [Acrocarpospora corrugata]GES01292.1 hypothetical protein Acor_33560 [Acrocarpospora corrugata]
MAKKKVGQIRISKRVVQIGHQVYPLANISRVQSLRVVWVGKSATFYPLRQIVGTALLAGAILAGITVVPDLNLDFEIGEMSQQAFNGVAVLAGLRIAYLLMVLLYRMLRRQQYSLVIETAGTQFTALSGTDLQEIQRIKDEIVGAIEDPPTEERTIQVHGDLVLGDQHKQTGQDSKMIFNR